MLLREARRRLRLYGTVLACVFLVAAIFYGVNSLFLWNMRESTDLKEVVDRHVVSQGLYAGIVHSYRAFKYEHYRRVKPEIVTIGTSRATQFRAGHFTRSFYNAAADDRTGRELARTYAELSRMHRPSIVIFTVDYWNFYGGEDGPLYAPPLLPPRPAAAASSIPRADQGEIYVVSQLLLDGRIEPRQYIAAALGLFPTRVHGIELIGAIAVQNHFGVLQDGSSFEYRKLPIAERFRHASEQIRAGNSQGRHFRRGVRIRSEEVHAIRDAVQVLRENGTQVVVIAPPLAPSVAALLRERPGDYKYIDEWRDVMTRDVPNFFDMHDARDIGSPDCEFVDSVHGGEVTYLRVLMHVAAARDSPLWGSVELGKTRQQIEKYRGQVVIAANRGDRMFGNLAQKYYDPICDGPGFADASASDR